MSELELWARLPARAREDTTKLPRAERQRINKEAHRLALEFEQAERARLTREAVWSGQAICDNPVKRHFSSQPLLTRTPWG